MTVLVTYIVQTGEQETSGFRNAVVSEVPRLDVKGLNQLMNTVQEMEKKATEKDEVGIVIFWIMPLLESGPQKKGSNIQIVPGKFPGPGRN